MSLIITKLGAAEMHTHAKKDGSGSFSKWEVPATLQRLADSNLPAGIQYTIWLNVDTQKGRETVEIAKAFIAGTMKVKGSNEFFHQDVRLGLNNDAESFDFLSVHNGKVKEYTGRNKSTGESYTILQDTIWLKDGCVFDWKMLETPVDKRHGNINDILAECDLDLVGNALLSAPIPSDLATTVEPY